MTRIEINVPNLILDDMPTNWGEGIFPRWREHHAREHKVFFLQELKTIRLPRWREHLAISVRNFEIIIFRVLNLVLT